ncbi:hypothetical protein [Thiolapillus sp.]
MENSNTVRTLAFAGMIAIMTPVGAFAADDQERLENEILAQGNAALAAMSTNLVHTRNWNQQVSQQMAQQLAKQAFAPETATNTDCTQSIVPVDEKKNLPVNPAISAQQG